MWIGLGVNPPGYEAELPTGNTTPRRVIAPPAHNSPSPNGTPAPPANWPVPWKKSPGPGMSDAVSTSVSVPADAPGVPDIERIAPPGKLEFAQPLPATPLFAHGQAAPLPSPEQNEIEIGSIRSVR